MPACGPIKRKELIYYLRQISFSGPYSGRKHQFMLKDICGFVFPIHIEMI
jgi:hypothetical protein